MLNQQWFKWLVLVSIKSLLNLLLYSQIKAVSIVYNFRISQITKQPISEAANDFKNTLTTLIFDQYQKKCSGVRQNYAGNLGTYVHTFAPFYVRTDLAFAHIKQTNSATANFSGTQMDDILFSAGYNHVISKRSLFTISGLFGIPTHPIYSLQEPNFGYSQIGIGAQLDGSYASTHNYTYLYGARYIRFLPRHAQDNTEQIYNLITGNLCDLLIAGKKNWGKHGLEIGYTARFAFGAKITPTFGDFVQTSDYIRSNIYAVYKYKYPLKNTWNRFLLNFGYGRDHHPKINGNKYIFLCWTSWSINF